MLIRFVVENYLSFRDEAEFNMLAGNFKIHQEHVCKAKTGVSLLRVATLYGANGAGKSNLAIAMEAAKDLVLLGSDTAKSKLPHRFFKLEKSCKEKPSRFEFEFVVNGNSYAFGIAFFSERIVEEWLYKTRPGKEDELVFERETTSDLKTVIKLSPRYLQTEKEKVKVEIYQEELRPNQPFITEAKEKDLVYVKEPYSWFEDVLEIVYPESALEGLFENILFNETYREKTNQIIKAIDTGVEMVEAQKINVSQLFGLHEKEEKEDILKWLEKGEVYEYEGKDEIKYGLYLDEAGEPQAVKLMTRHQSNGDTVDFDFYEESDGTQRLIELTPAFIDTMLKEKVYVVDEFNRSMHPQMAQKLIEMYLSHDSKLSKGQLVFTTHESGLLDLKLFRQDEIWFVEKDKTGSSKIYPLSEFKPRYDKDIRRGYLQGRFGAIPFLSSLENINW
ncbi:MAG: ATP-binding protein [Saprospiraceae bacterium]|nr:ATP-binding protein [Saprospiraceae bacterium]MCC6725100.1 ATP-binding protein [Saprospiraceae bacterium]